MITPRVLKGTSDYGPLAMAQRNHVFSILRQLFESYGYDTIETPVLEYAETILGKYGEEGDKLTYNFKDHGDRHIALRYDQTVPFARFYATNWFDLPSPFKRYQISRVWRADKPQRGRQREFYQCDIDIIGTESLAAEAELMQMAVSGFENLGLEDAKILINDRNFLNDFLTQNKVEESDFVSVIRCLDKLDKIGVEGVEKELVEKANIDADIASNLLLLLNITGTNDQKLKALSTYDVSNLEKLFELCNQLGIPGERLEFVPTLARGLDYYTGVVFEAVLEKDRKLGSVGSGGRYADLCGTFSKQDFPGVGFSFGFARIMQALLDREMLENIPLAADVLMVCFSDELKAQNSLLANELRAAGFNVDFYFEPDKLSKQFKYADKKQIPFVIVQGVEEAENGTIMLKNMQTGEQETLQTEELADYLFNQFENQHECEDDCCY